MCLQLNAMKYRGSSKINWSKPAITFLSTVTPFNQQFHPVYREVSVRRCCWPISRSSETSGNEIVGESRERDQLIAKKGSEIACIVFTSDSLRKQSERLLSVEVLVIFQLRSVGSWRVRSPVSNCSDLLDSRYNTLLRVLHARGVLKFSTTSPHAGRKHSTEATSSKFRRFPRCCPHAPMFLSIPKCRVQVAVARVAKWNQFGRRQTSVVIHLSELSRLLLNVSMENYENSRANSLRVMYLKAYLNALCRRSNTSDLNLLINPLTVDLGSIATQI